MNHLRPYQQTAIESLRALMRAGNRRVVLAAATGAGKTVMAMALIEAARKLGSRCLFICERRVLVKQVCSQLNLLGIEHGVFMAGERRGDRSALVQVASAQTLERMNEWPAFDLVFIDEIHACMRKSVITMFDTFPTRYVIGMTATPFHPLIPKYFTAHTNVQSMKELVAEGHLVPFRIFAATEINTKGVPVVAGEWQKDELEKRGLQVVGDIVNDYLRLVAEVWKGVTPKTICFSAGVDHGASLVEKFRAVGVNAVQISYRDSEQFKEEVLRDFKRVDTQIQMVISADILTRGYDQTDVRHVITARPLRKSFSSHVQQVGRGARPHPGKEFCCVQDHSNNWLRFLDDWEDLFAHGVRSLESGVDAKVRKEPTDEQKREAKCPKCHALWPAGADACVHCGHVRQRRNRVMAVPGQLLELGASRPGYSPEYQRDFYAQLLGYAQERGWKRAWARHKYQSKFGTNPSEFMAPDPVYPPDPAVGRWIKSELIRWAKSRQAA